MEDTMKKHLFAVTFLVLGLAVLAPSIRAQTYLNLNTTIPFDFTIGSRVMPAGDYEVRGDTVRGALIFQRTDRAASHAVIAIPVEAPKAPATGKLVFKCYDGRCFLSQLWSPLSATGRQFPKSKLEMEVARNGAGRNVLVATTPH
jgi:hypothetical protein